MKTHVRILGWKEGVIKLRDKRKYRLHVLTGVVHNLDGGCGNGRRIKNGNFKDFYTYEEAVMEMNEREKDAHKCKKCKWPN